MRKLGNECSSNRYRQAEVWLLSVELGDYLIQLNQAEPKPPTQRLCTASIQQITT